MHLYSKVKDVRSTLVEWPTLVEWATRMWVYAGSSLTGTDHRKKLILALYCSLNDVK